MDNAIKSHCIDSGSPSASAGDAPSRVRPDPAPSGFLTPRHVFWFGTTMILAFTGLAAWCFALPLWYVAGLSMLDLLLLLLLFLWMESPYDPTAGDDGHARTQSIRSEFSCLKRGADRFH